MPQIEVELSMSDRLGSLADKPIDLGDDVYFSFLNFGFCHQKTGLEILLTSWDCDDESYKKCLVQSNPSRNFGFCLFFSNSLDPWDQSIWEAISSELAVAVNQWADCLDLGGRQFNSSVSTVCFVLL